jgi:general secretion pathway protein K
MRRAAEKGIALIAVLWILALLSTIAASIAWETRTDARIARNMADNAAARSAADAGIQRAILDLAASPTPPTQAKKFQADGKTFSWPFADGTVYLTIQDEASKIDLNQAPEALLVALFGSNGVDADKAKALAAAIVDFRDADNLPRPQGAEDAEYRARGLAWGPKNAPFQSVEELHQVLGITPAIYDRVAPELTIYSSAIGGSPIAGPLTTTLGRAGFNVQPLANSPGTAFSIHAEAKSATGAVYVRDAVVQLLKEQTSLVLLWRKGDWTSSHPYARQQSSLQ